MAMSNFSVCSSSSASVFQLQHQYHTAIAFDGRRPLQFSLSRRNASCQKTLVREVLCKAEHNATSLPVITDSSNDTEDDTIGFIGIHHVGVLCKNLERSLEFYCGLLGLEVCNLRPNDRLRYRGAWLWVGDQMIHLMELPNPDPISGRPAHGGEDRHICVSVKNPMKLKSVLEQAGIPYTMSKSGRPVIFTRDPDGNALECQPSYMHNTPKG